MTQSRIIFFLAVLGIVVGIAKCNSRQQAHMIGYAPTPTPAATGRPVIAAASPSPAPAATPAATVAQVTPPDFKKAAGKVTPAVIAVSVFDASGKLLRTGTGFFVSDDGRFVTSRSVIQGASNAVAKTKDGGIFNVLGFLADVAPVDVAVLKAQVKDDVPFLTLSEGAAAKDKGKAAAIIGNPESSSAWKLTETSVSPVKTDPNGDFLELPSLPSEMLGAPVIDEEGNVLGVVALQRGAGTASTVARVAAAVGPILAKIESHAKPVWQGDTPLPPAAGPTVAQSPTAPGTKKLVYSPAPLYPTAARYSYFPAKGSGRFAVKFGNDGKVMDVQVLQSTRNSTLDQAAVDTLRRWKATPGQSWTATVPISFQP